MRTDVRNYVQEKLRWNKGFSLEYRTPVRYTDFMFATLRSKIVEHGSTFDAGALTAAEAGEALDDLVVVQRIVDAMVAQTMKRIADSDAHAGTSFRNAATYIANKSSGMKVASKAEHPEAKKAIALGEALFFRRQGPFDFSCATCHAESGKRIRLQPLPFLSDPKEDKQVVGEWPAYRVSSTHVMTMQHRLLDCYWQMRLHRLDFASDVSVALSAFLYDRARDGEIAAPGLKR